MTCVMKREAWTWYLPSHLVPAKILCSRCEPCTKNRMCSDLFPACQQTKTFSTQFDVYQFEDINLFNNKLNVVCEWLCLR